MASVVFRERGNFSLRTQPKHRPMVFLIEKWKKMEKGSDPAPPPSMIRFLLKLALTISIGAASAWLTAAQAETLRLKRWPKALSAISKTPLTPARSPSIGAPVTAIRQASAPAGA